MRTQLISPAGSGATTTEMVLVSCRGLSLAVSTLILLGAWSPNSGRFLHRLSCWNDDGRADRPARPTWLTQNESGHVGHVVLRALLSKSAQALAYAPREPPKISESVEIRGDDDGDRSDDRGRPVEGQGLLKGCTPSYVHLPAAAGTDAVRARDIGHGGLYLSQGRANDSCGVTDTVEIAKQCREFCARLGVLILLEGSVGHLVPQRPDQGDLRTPGIDSGALQRLKRAAETFPHPIFQAILAELAPPPSAVLQVIERPFSAPDERFRASH